MSGGLRPEDAPAHIYGPDGRPQFFQDPAMDRFAEAFTRLVSEVWVVRERLATLEEAAARKGSVTAEEIAAVSQDSAVNAAREDELAAFVQRVLAPLRES